MKIEKILKIGQGIYKNPEYGYKNLKLQKLFQTFEQELNLSVEKI